MISQLRETQNQEAPPRSIPPPSLTIPSPSWSSGPLSGDIVDVCLDFFFTHMYATMPVLDHSVRQLVQDVPRSPEAYCLISSLSAFMLIQPGIQLRISPAVNGRPTSPSVNTSLGSALMEDAMRVQKTIDYIEHPTVNAVITSFFLFACCFGLNRHNSAWYHLRQATTLAQMMGMQEESTYSSMEASESIRRRRLFWLLFVTERAYALQKHHPLSLHATIGLPDTIPTSPATTSIASFLHLVNLYRCLDDTFVGLWNKARADCTPIWLSQLQQQINVALPPYLTNVPESQAADLRISQHWLRTMVWQLSISGSFLSSSSPDPAMRFTYPIEIAKDLVHVVSTFSRHALEVHGIGLIEKLFDIACTLVDVMSCVPLHPANMDPDPLYYLRRLVDLIYTLRGGESKFSALLETKIRDTLPSMAPVILRPNSSSGVGSGGGGSSSNVSVGGTSGKSRRGGGEADSISNCSSRSSPVSISTPPFVHQYQTFEGLHGRM